MPSSPTHKNLGSLIEKPESARYQFTKTGVVQTRIYGGTRALCLSSAPAYGTLGTSDQLGYYVENTEVVPKKGEQAELIVTWRTGSPDGSGGDGGVTNLPVDEVSVTPMNQSPQLERHPRYAWMESSTVTVDGVDYPAFAAIRNAAQASNPTDRATWRDALVDASLVDGIEAVSKLDMGQESFYLATLRYTWATHFWSPPIITRGGYRQSPLGPLAGYFVADIDWLREADDLQLSGGIWRLTRSWLGADVWDTDLYPQ